MASGDRPRAGPRPDRGLVPGGGMAVSEAAPARRFTGIDIATLAYVGLATVALLLSFQCDPIPGWGWLFVAHALLVLLGFVAPLARAGGAAGRFLGEWYPMLLLAALY